MRAWFLVLAVACAAQPPPLANVTIPSRATDPELDALGFLDGCWHQWSVDWGFTWCWKRDGSRWRGSFTSHGPMGPHWTAALQIERGARTLELRTGKTESPWFAGMARVAMSRRTERGVTFGTLRFELDPREGELLFFQLDRGTRPYRLRASSAR